MSISVSTIIKGALQRLSRKKKTARFKPISWMQEKRLKHQDNQTSKTISIGNIHLSYKRPYEVLHTYKELFEGEIYNFTAAGSTPLIIDCGANIGLSVLYFKSIYPGATVIAYEPDEANFQLLLENIQLNNLTNVECKQSAVWISNEPISFVSDGTQGSGIATGKSSSNIIQIKAERLADVVKSSKVDFLKIDIEGAEAEVIKDCGPYLKNVENLFVEYHGKTTDTEKLAWLIDVLKMHFQVYIKMAADNLTHPFVDKKTEGDFDVQLNIFCYR